MNPLIQSLSLCACSLAFSSPVLAGDESHTTAVTRVVTSDGGDKQPCTIEIRVEDGKVTARMNGQEVPADRVLKKDGRIIILDEKGNPVAPGHMFQAFSPDGQSSIIANELIIEGMDGHEGLTHLKLNPTVGAIAMAEEPKVMIGVTMDGVDPALAKHLRIAKPEECTLISGLYKGLPADKAGLQEFDVVVRVNGQTPANDAAVREAIRAGKPGDTIRLSVIQAGKPMDIEVTLAPYDSVKMQESEFVGRSHETTAGTRLWKMLEEQPLVDAWGNSHTWEFVAPDGDQWQRFVVPRQELEWQGGRGAPLDSDAAPRSRSELESRLDRLDSRLADLETSLGRLMEKLDKR